MPVVVGLINPPVADRRVWVREGRCQQWDIWGAPFPPLSLALVSTQLVRAGSETFIVDAGPEHKDLDHVLAECRSRQPALVILATATPTIISDCDWFAGELRKALPHVRIAVTGIHVSVLPEETLQRFANVDFVIVGEPEITSRELAESLDGKRDMAEVRGVAYRGQDGALRKNSTREFLAELDALGMPDWSKVDFRNYPLPIVGRPFSLVVFARGCPYTCKFCATHAYNGNRVRRRSVAGLIAEIRYNMSLGVRDFLFWTEQMTLDAEFLNAFLDAIIKEGLHREIAWVCNSRVDAADPALFRKMRDAGCWQMAFGFEFGDDRTLTLAGKGGRSTVAQGRLAAEMARTAGILVDGHFIMGYPGETPDSLQKTIDFACELPLTFAHFYAATPFPGSALYEEAVREGWIDPNDWGRFNQDTPVIDTPSLSARDVQRYMAKAYRSFYLRPRIISALLRVPKTPRQYLRLFRIGLQFAGLKL